MSMRTFLVGIAVGFGGRGVYELAKFLFAAIVTWWRRRIAK